MLTYVLAVLAACANATSSVLQRKANRRAPRRENMSLRLIWSLAHEPVWFGGILAVTAGFLLQAAALGGGQLSVVEPILVLELPATLILASRVFETRMHRREWGSQLAAHVPQDPAPTSRDHHVRPPRSLASVISLSDIICPNCPDYA